MIDGKNTDDDRKKRENRTLNFVNSCLNFTASKSPIRSMEMKTHIVPVPSSVPSQVVLSSSWGVQLTLLELPASSHVPVLITLTGNNTFDRMKIDDCDRWIVI